MESFKENAIEWSKKFVARLQQHTATIASHEQLVDQGKILCKEYVHNRLKHLGILSIKLQLEPNKLGSSTTDVSEELQRIGGELERMYPDLYKNISGQLNVNLSNEESVRKTYIMFADQLCKGDIHWGKVVALFAMAGAFAEDCVQQGHPEFVGKVVESFGTFASRKLVGWVAKQGGWVIPNFIRDQKTETWFWLVATVGAIVGFFFTLLITLWF